MTQMENARCDAGALKARQLFRAHNTQTAKRWPHPYACELDAIPPDDLRALVRTAIEQHLPADELAGFKRTEELERETMMQFLGNGGGAA